MPITEQESESPRTVGVSPVVIIVAVLVIVLFAISAVTYLVSVGRETNQVIALLTLIAAPTITALLALVKISRQDSTITTIQRQTNGKMTNFDERVSDVERQLAIVKRTAIPEEEHDGQ